MAADNGGITIPVSVIDNTQAGLQKAQNNILRAISSVPSEFRFTASLNSGDFSSAIAEITKGTYTAESRLKALTKAIQDNNKPLGKGQAKDMAKNILSNFDAYTKAAARLEQMSSKFKDFQKIAGDAINLRNVPDAKGGLGSIDKLIAEFNSLNSALNFKGENGKDLSANEIAKKLQLLQKLNENAAATMSMFGRFGKDLDAYKRGGATSQKLLESLGLSQEEYDKALSTLRSNEQKFTNQIAQILTQSGDTLAKKQAAWRKASKGEGSVANLFSELRNEATRLNTESNFNVAGFSAVDLLFTRLESIAKRRKALMQSFSKGDVTAIMRELNSYKRRANFALSTGDMDVIAAFNNNSAWGKSMQASKAVEQTLKANNEQLSVLKKREEITNQIVKTQQRLLELEKKGIDVASQLNNLNHARTLLTSSYAEGVSPQRAAFLANDSSSWLASVSKQTKEMEDAARKKEAADKALNGILQGVGGTNTRLGQFALKGIDVSDYSSRLQNISNGINNALNSSDLQQKTNAVNELRKALKELQNDITLGTSKSIIDSKTQAALNSVNQQLTSFQNKRIGNFSNTLDRYERNGMDVSSYRASLVSIKNDLDAALNETDLERKRQALRNLTNELDKLQVKSKGDYDKFAFDKRTAKNFDDATAAAKRYEAELDRVANAHKNNYSLVSQLGQEIAMVYSIQQVKQFLSSIVEIGGQFEQQRMAIGAILGDAHKANVIFEQVKQLGLHSNFTTLELDKYVKELSAFDIEYNQLFDKMKKLADISAGTGTDMSRIVLAYGHVKAAGYLEGMQRRQFTNANINIIAGLRDLYKKREGKDPGSRDIYKRISAKQVSYEDVDKVLMSLAEPGGKFYNMQETMANTTKGVWKNLGDAINHMYLALNTQFEGPIVAIGRTLTNFTKIVTRLTPYILSLGGAFATVKLMQAASTIAMGRHNATTLSAIRTENKRKISILETARSYRVLTEAEEAELAARKKGAMMWANSKGGDRVKNATLSGVSTGRVSYFETNRLVNTGAISEAEAKRANSQFVAMTSNTNKLKVAWNALKFQSVGLWNSIAAGARIAGTAVKGFMAAMWPMLVLEGLIAGYTWFSNKDKKDLEDKQKMLEANESTINGLADALERYENVVVKNMSTEEVFDMEKDLLTSLKDNVGSYRDILNEIYKKDDQGRFLYSANERAEKLRESLKNIKKGIEDIKDKDFISSFGKISDISSRQHTTGDWWDHSFSKNVELFKDSYEGLAATIGRLSKKEKKDLKSFINTIADSNPTFKAFRDETGKLNDNLQEQIMLAAELGQIQIKGSNKISNYKGEELENFDSIREYIGRIESIKAQWNEAIKSPKFPVDVKSLNKIQFKNVAFEFAYNKTNSKEAAEEIAEYLTSLQFNIPINVKPKISEDDIEKDNSWRKELTKFFENNAQFEATINASANLEDARDKCQQLYESVYKNWENLKKTQKALNLDINLNINDGNIKERKSELEQRLLSLKSKLDHKPGLYMNGGDAGLSEAEQQSIKAQIAFLESCIKSLDTMIVGTQAQKAGYLDDPNKNKSKNKNTTKETDKELKDFKQKVTALGKLLQTYKKLKQEWGETEALSTLTSSDTEEGKTFRDYFKDKNFSEKAILDMYDEFLKTAKKGGKDKEGWETIANELASKIFDIKDETIKEGVDSIIQKIDMEIEKRKGKMSLYRSIFDSTGDKDLAKRYAEFDEFDKYAKNIESYDSYTYAIESFDKKMQELKYKHHNTDGRAYTYDILDNMSYEEFSKVAPEIQNMFKTANNEVENGKNEQKKKFAEIIQNYHSVYQKLKAEQEKIASLKLFANEMVKNGSISQEDADRMTSRMEAMNNLNVMEESSEFAWFSSYALPFYSQQVEDYGKKFKKTITDAFNTGGLSAKDFQEKLKKIDEIMLNNSKNGSKGFGTKFNNFLKNSKFSNIAAAADIKKDKGISKRELATAKLDNARNELENSDWYKKLSKGDKKWLENKINTGAYDSIGYINDEKARKAIESIKTARQEIDEAEGLIKDAENKKAAFENFEHFTEGFNNIASSVNNALGSIKKFYQSIGDEATADDIEMAQTGISAVQNIFEGFRTGSWIGGIIATVGEGFNFVAELFQHQDKEKERAIKNLNRDLTTTKNIQSQIQWSLDKWYKSVLGGNELYSDLSRNLREQLAYTTQMRNLEASKHNVDKDALQSYNQQITELKQQLSDIKDTMMQEMYGIDFSSWADTLTNALKDAFDNGKDAALAWESSVGDIMRNIASDMIKTMYIEPMLKEVYSKYFGNNGRLIDSKTGILTDDQKTLEYEIANMGDDIRAFMSSSLMNGAEYIYDMMEELFPASGTDETTGGLSKIGENMTEETASLTASYINAIRTDVSASRAIANQQLDTLNQMNGHIIHIEQALDSVHRCWENATNGVTSIHVK